MGCGGGRVAAELKKVVWMTREEIEGLEGRFLDAAIASKIFGDDVVWVVEERAKLIRRLPDGQYLVVPPYSDSMADAWRVVLRMAQLGYDLEIHELTLRAGYEDRPFISLSFGRRKTDHARNLYGYEGPVPVAICRAALIARCGEENADADA